MSDLSSVARGGGLRDEVTVLLDRPLVTRAQAGDVQIQAVAMAEPPHRLTGMVANRVGEAVTDARLAAPPADVTGDVPVAAVAVAEEVFIELGLPGLALASGDGDGRTWELASTGARGTAASGLGGYAALEALIADVSGQPYPDAVARLVLDPLGMGNSWFPQRWPTDGTPVVTGYQLDKEGDFRPAPAHVGTVRAATGLWTTTADLLRFGLGWSSLLPGELASEALRPQTAPLDGRLAGWGLGWRVNQTHGVAGQAGRSRGTSVSLVMRLDSGRIHVAMTNRSIPVEPVNGRVAQAIANDQEPEN